MVKAIEMAATLLGFTVRVVWFAIRLLPQAAALVLIIYGIWLFDHRVAMIASGLAMLALSAPGTRPTDRRDK